MHRAHFPAAGLMHALGKHSAECHSLTQSLNPQVLTPTACARERPSSDGSLRPARRTDRAGCLSAPVSCFLERRHSRALSACQPTTLTTHHFAGKLLLPRFRHLHGLFAEENALTPNHFHWDWNPTDIPHHLDLLQPPDYSISQMGKRKSSRLQIDTSTNLLGRRLFCWNRRACVCRTKQICEWKESKSEILIRVMSLDNVAKENVPGGV